MIEPDRIIEIKDLKKTFSISGGLLSRRLTLTALSDINFTIRQGETLGIVGESGCGKSTLGRCILQLLAPDEGKVLWLGQDLTKLPAEEMRKRRADLQIIFQDPLASLNPRMTVGEIIADPLRTLRPELSKDERRARVLKIMEAVGLLPEMINRWVPGGIYPLGTDGYGRSDGRRALRRFFEVDAEHIALAALSALARRGEVKPSRVDKAIKELGIDPDKPDPQRA